MMKIFHILKIGGGLVTKSYSILETLWTTVHQALPSMGFPMQEYWSGLPFPSPGYLLDLKEAGNRASDLKGNRKSTHVFISHST